MQISLPTHGYIFKNLANIEWNGIYYDKNINKKFIANVVFNEGILKTYPPNQEHNIDREEAEGQDGVWRGRTYKTQDMCLLPFPLSWPVSYTLLVVHHLLLCP